MHASLRMAVMHLLTLVESNSHYLIPILLGYLIPICPSIYFLFLLLFKPLAILMNRSLAEGAIPSDCIRKHAMVTPMFKVGSKTDPENYRPILVLPAFVKILERAVHTMVYDYLQENQMLTDCRLSFRPQQSTSTCLIDTTNKLLHNIDKGLLTGMIFLDLSKAFDTLDHNKMQEKLSLLGLNASSVLWFNEYLTNRTQSVIINGAVSDPQSIPFGVIPIGVPQLGSILGPLLFIVYINELPSVVKNCNIKLYADDTLVYFGSNSITTIESILSEDLNRIIDCMLE